MRHKNMRHYKTQAASEKKQPIYLEPTDIHTYVVSFAVEEYYRKIRSPDALHLNCHRI